MKRSSTVLLALGLLLIVGAANSATILHNWPFRAPSISNPDAIDPKTAGDITFDTATDSFKGYNGSSWVNFGSSTAANLAVAIKTSAYTLTSTDDVILADASSAAFTLTLPSAAATGKVFYIKKQDSSSNAVTVDGNASETIDGLTTVGLQIQNEAITIVSDGSNWKVLAKRPAYHTEMATVYCASSGSGATQSGNWISGVADISSGSCVVSMNSGIFSSAPRCWANFKGLSGGHNEYAITAYSSTTSFTLSCKTNLSNCSGPDYVDVFCMGPY